MGSINKQISRYEATAVYTHPDAKVDIVLVHGLNGDPQKTWTAKNGVFWPADLLPASLRDAKANVLVYGYNADVYSKKHGSHPSDNFIYLHAQTLVTSLTHYRKDEQTSRNPIIWVCHSLGGILVKRALLYSNDLKASQHEDYRSIYVSTYGLVFLGTPHTGSDIAAWGTILQGMSDAVIPKSFFQSESVLLKTLKRDNETLQNINNHFLDVYQRFKILMAHENHKTDLKGTSMLIVDSTSAGPQLPGVTYYAIEATHSGMCKFESRNAPGYRTVVTAIREWVVDATDVIATRWRIEDEERLARAKHEIEERMKPWIQSQQIAHHGREASSRSPQSLMVEYMLDGDSLVGTPFEDVLHPFEVEEPGEHAAVALRDQINETTSHVSQNTPIKRGEQSKLLPEPEGEPPPRQIEPSSQPMAADDDAPSEPIFVKPAVFRPNTFFKGREKELKQLHKMLMDRGRRSAGTSSVLIQSMPGGGKSHLARQYVFQHRHDYPGGIFWIRAKSVKELEYGYWDIAKTAGLREADDLDRDEEKGTRRMVVAVRAWLNSSSNWLLILDGIHFDIPDLQYYIPFTKDTSIIFTSTEQTVAEAYQFDYPQVIALDALTKEEAQELLLEEMGKKTPWTQDDLSRAAELVESMDRLPLMIHVAAQHLRATREPLAKYVRSFKNRPRVGNLPAYHEVRKQLQHRGVPAALNLMYMLSFFGQHIPVEMVALGAKALGRSTPVKSSSAYNLRISLNNTLQILIAFALIERYQNNETSAASSRSNRSIDMGQDNLDILRVHGIVQAFFVDVLADEKEAPFWLEQAISVFCKAFDESKRRVKDDPQAGMPQDFRRFRIHGERLIEHLDRFQRRAPDQLAPWRSKLDLRLQCIAGLIDQLSKRDSDGQRQRSRDMVVSVFERTNSLSEADSSTPPSTNSVLEFYTEDNTPLESPTAYNSGGYNPYHWHVTYPYGVPPMAEEDLDISRTVTPQPDPDPTEVFDAIYMPDDDETTQRVFGPNHRTIRKQAARRYRDHPGAWRVLPQFLSDPRVSISRETAKGLISTGPPGQRAALPPIVSSDDDSGAANSEAEVALNQIKQGSPSLRPQSLGTSVLAADEQAASSVVRPKLIAGRTSYASPSASETNPEGDDQVTPTFCNVIGTYPAPSSSYTAATIMRLKENERPVPVSLDGLAPVKVSSPLAAAEPITRASTTPTTTTATATATATTTALRRSPSPKPVVTAPREELIAVPEADPFDFMMGNPLPPPSPPRPAVSRSARSSPAPRTGGPFAPPPPIPFEVHATSSLRNSPPPPPAGHHHAFDPYAYGPFPVPVPEHAVIDEAGEQGLTRSLPSIRSYPGQQLPYPHTHTHSAAPAATSSVHPPSPRGESFSMHVHPPPWTPSPQAHAHVPHSQAHPYPVPPNAHAHAQAQAQAHIHSQGYSSQPMSRDASHQSSRSQGSNMSNMSMSSKSSTTSQQQQQQHQQPLHPYQQQRQQQRPRQGSSGSYSSSFGPPPQIMQWPRSRRPSVVETEPSPRLGTLDYDDVGDGDGDGAFGSSDLVVDAGYRIYNESFPATTAATTVGGGGGRSGRRGAGSASASASRSASAMAISDLPYPVRQQQQQREVGFLRRLRSRRRGGGGHAGESAGDEGDQGDADGDDESSNGDGSGGHRSGSGKKEKRPVSATTRNSSGGSSHGRARSAGNRIAKLRGRKRDGPVSGSNSAPVASSVSVSTSPPVQSAGSAGNSGGADMARSSSGGSSSGGFRLADGTVVGFGGTAVRPAPAPVQAPAPAPAPVPGPTSTTAAAPPAPASGNGSVEAGSSDVKPRRGTLENGSGNGSPPNANANASVSPARRSLVGLGIHRRRQS